MNPGAERGNGRKETNIADDAQQVFRQVGKRFYLETPPFHSSANNPWFHWAWVRDGNLLRGSILASPASPKQDAGGKASPPRRAPAAVKTGTGSIFLAGAAAHELFLPESQGAALKSPWWTEQKLKPKPNRKTQTENTFLPASLSEIRFSKSKNVLGLKEWDNFISGFAADLWCLFYHSKKSYLLYSLILLFVSKDSGETGRRRKFSIYPQNKLKKKPQKPRKV